MSAPIPRPGPPPGRPVPGPPTPGNGPADTVAGGPAGTLPRNDPAGTVAGGAAGTAGAGQDAAATVAAVGDSVAHLDQLDDLPVADHVARYDALHGTLSDALAAIDGV